jgi:hypothetical protein
VLDEALCQQAIISGFGQPNKHDMEFLQNWLARSKAEGIFFIGQDNKVWDTNEDLFALSLRESPDFFSDWLTNGFMPYFYRKIGHRFIVSLICRSPIPLTHLNHSKKMARLHQTSFPQLTFISIEEREECPPFREC